MDNITYLWNPHTGRLLHTLTGHEDWVISTAFTPDSSLLATGSFDWTTRIWNAHTGEHLLTLDHPGRVHHVTFSPDGSQLTVVGDDPRALVWAIDPPR